VALNGAQHWKRGVPCDYVIEGVYFVNNLWLFLLVHAPFYLYFSPFFPFVC